jgi:predicted alpha/beta superfamily hydrolase
MPQPLGPASRRQTLRQLAALASLPVLTPSQATASALTAGGSLEVRLDLGAEIAAGRFDPALHRVGLRGAHPPLSWGSSWPLEPEPGSEPAGRFWHGRVPFDSLPFGGQPLAWKAKIDGLPSPGDGWEPGANHRTRLKGPSRIERSFGAAAEPLPPRRTGRIERWAPISADPLAQREVQVWWPPGEDGHRPLPMLLMHDGQNVFDDASAGAEWMLDETAERLVRNGAVAPMLIVAVASTAARIDDYTPWPGRMSRGGDPVGGGGAAYAAWLAGALLPELERRLPLVRGPAGRERRFVGGSSLGGLMSMWMLLAQPALWGGALVVSPSVWWSEGRLLDEIPQRGTGAAAPRLWLDIGRREGAEEVGGAERLSQRLSARGWAHRFVLDEAAGHDEASWASRGEAMLRFLLSPT